MPSANRNHPGLLVEAAGRRILVDCGALNFARLDPIKALYWSAVINGVLAAPVIVMLMVLVRRKKVMGKFTVQGGLYWLGWASTAAMALCILGMGATVFL